MHGWMDGWVDGRDGFVVWLVSDGWMEWNGWWVVYLFFLFMYVEVRI